MPLSLPYLSYGNVMWGSVHRTFLKDLLDWQKKAIRIISKAKYFDHTEPLYKALELLNLDKTYRLNCLLFIYKLINLNLHKAIKRRIVRNSDFHNHLTRNRSKYRLPGTRLKCVRQSCLYFGLSLWNKINKDIIDSKTIYNFKRQIKIKLLEE